MILRLTRMELKKIGWKKTLLVFIALSLPWLYIYTVSLQDVHRINWQELSYIKTVQGPLTEEKYQMISDDLKNLGYDSSAELRETTEEEMEQLSQRGKYGDTIGNDKYFMENALNTCNYILNQEHLRLTIMEQARQNLKMCIRDSSSTCLFLQWSSYSFPSDWSCSFLPAMRTLIIMKATARILSAVRFCLPWRV